jgi:hypothetical protein
MKKTIVESRLFFILIYFSIILSITLSYDLVQATSYPIKINVVTKNKADYLTPENALAAGFSALMHNDLEWYYQSLTEKSADQDKAQLAKAGIDPNENLDLVEIGDQLFLIDKSNYKNGMLLHIKMVSPDGTIATGSVVFVQEKGLWKQTFEYAADEDLYVYLDAAPPEEIFNTEIRLFPDHWNYQWYQQILNKKSKQQGSDLKTVSVLCVLGNIKDTSGNIQSVEDIDPETLVLNYVVKPTAWHFGKKNKTFILIENKTSNHLPHKSFKNWEKQHQLRPGFEGPVMLVKFNKFEAISSLDNLDDKKTHTITISGKLKDNETHFRGETQITLIPPGSPNKQHKPPASPATENLFHNHWWDQDGR